MAAASSQPKETDCAVCTNGFSTPKILPCGHLLCRECVISWMDHTPNAGCPLCGFPIADPQVSSERSSADVADLLPTDFVMETLVENARVLARDPICCVCDGVKAESICLQCLDMLCPSCTKSHKKLAMSQNHDVESLSSVTPERLTATRPALCADHKDKQADLFCVDHGLTLCTSCSFINHMDCSEVRQLQDQIKSTEKHASELVDALVNAEHDLEEDIAQVDVRIHEVKDSAQKDAEKVDMECDRLQKLLDDYRNKLKDMSCGSHSEVMESLYDIKNLLGQQLGIVTSHRQMAARVRAVAPHPALIGATKVLQDRISNLDLSPTPKKDLPEDPLQVARRCEGVVRRMEKELHISGEEMSSAGDNLLSDISDRLPCSQKQRFPAEAQTFWVQWAEAAFTDLDEDAYFLPLCFNWVTTDDSSAGEPPLDQDSDVRDDAELQQVLCCLEKMSRKNEEVLVATSWFQVGQYLGQQFYADAATNLTKSSNLPLPLPRSSRDGGFDVSLIHRQYGLVVIKVMRFSENLKKLRTSRINATIRKKLTHAVSQLDKTEAMLSHLVSDVTPGLRITKTIALPNVTALQVQQAISGDTKLVQDLCRCLGTTDPADITGLCLCSDQLSDPETPWDVSSDVLTEVENWWQRRVAVSGPDSYMTFDNYKRLVARIGGPATTVTVPCTSPPRLCVKTLGQAVSWTGECYTAQITLFPEQVYLLNTAYYRQFIAGPPGTGKTAVLLLKATEWLRCGNDVDIVSTCRENRAACSMLYHLLLQGVNSQDASVVSPGQPHLRQYSFSKEKDVEEAVKDLSLAARDESLYVIADEATGSYFKTFCEKLLTEFPRLHLWAASFYEEDAPTDWYVECLTRPLRSPLEVVMKVKEDWEITEHMKIQQYSERSVPGYTVTRLYHGGIGHRGRHPEECVKCGRNVARYLHKQRVVVAENVASASTTHTTSGGTTPAYLQWRDVLVLYWVEASDKSGFMEGLTEAGIPVRLMNNDDTDDVATARSDVVWVVWIWTVRSC